MASDFKPSNLDYGVVIAFVAPGFVAFHGASYYLPTAKAWMTAAADKEQSVGVFLFVLLASLSAGLIVSGIRALVIDKLLRFSSILKGFAVPSYTVDWSRVDEKSLSVIVTIRDGHYRYYQFYSNTFVAMVFWAISVAFADERGFNWAYWLLIGAILFALLLSARMALNSYVHALKQFFSKPC